MKIFNKNLKTQRLELRILEPTLENAKLVWDVLKVLLTTPLCIQDIDNKDNISPKKKIFHIYIFLQNTINHFLNPWKKP